VRRQVPVTFLRIIVGAGHLSAVVEVGLLAQECAKLAVRNVGRHPEGAL